MTPDGAPIAETLLDRLRRERRWTHERVLALAADLTDGQLRWRAGPHAPSIGFHLWHLARWADYDAYQLSGRAQVWEARGLASAWGFPAGLGQFSTGTEMGDEAAQDLALPAKATLLDYARAAFTALGEALDALPAGDLLQPIRPPQNEDRKLEVVFAYVTHDNRHLGMIEALRGLLDRPGTATR